MELPDSTSAEGGVGKKDKYIGDCNIPPFNY